MKILYYYYSGTGNTEYLVNKIKAEFEKYGAEITLCNVTDVSKEAWKNYNPAEYDMIGFSYPVYGFRTPKYFEEFAVNLEIRDKTYFIIKDSRECLHANDSSSRWMVKALKKKGCKLLQERHLLLPYNTQFRHDDRLVKQMLLALDEKIPVIVKSILDGKKKRILFHPYATLVAKLVGGVMQKGAKGIGNSFHATEACISCGKCANNCPRQNITMEEVDGKKVPDFNHDRCMLCMRCIMNCPAECIKIEKFITGWEVYGRYDFEKILNDESITPDFITKKSHGKMVASYKRYFFRKIK